MIDEFGAAAASVRARDRAAPQEDTVIIVSGSIHVDPEARDGYLAGCRNVIEQARLSPGCLDFTIAADPLEPGRINVYERWESDAQLEQFRGTGPDQEQTAEIRDAEVHRYRISAVEAA